MGKALVALSPATEKEPVLASLRFERFTPRTITHLVQLKEELVKTQKRGCAVDDEEATLGARCVSTPIFLECGKLVAAVSVSGPRARMASRKIPLLVSAVQRAAKTISVRLTAAGLQ